MIYKSSIISCFYAERSYATLYIPNEDHTAITIQYKIGFSFLEMVSNKCVSPDRKSEYTLSPKNMPHIQTQLRTILKKIRISPIVAFHLKLSLEFDLEELTVLLQPSLT